jgi:transcriptional regulator with XRE-family HTH domain
MPAGQHMRDDFAALLLRLRRAAGLTQEDLATRAGLSERSIRDIERGRVRTPQRRTAAALADALRLHDVERLRFMSYARATRTHDEPESGRAPRIAVPQQLPPVLSDLTGRDGELDDLAGVAATVAAWGGAAPTVLAIHGPPASARPVSPSQPGAGRSRRSPTGSSLSSCVARSASRSIRARSSPSFCARWTRPRTASPSRCRSGPRATGP